MLHKEELAKLITFECVSTEPTLSRDAVGGARPQTDGVGSLGDVRAGRSLAGVQAQPETPVCGFRKCSDRLGLKCWHIKVQRCSPPPKFS